MVGGQRCYCSYFVHSIVLLLWVCLHYVEASSGKHVIHKKVGDTVELSSGLPTEGVTVATWRYGGITVADKDVGVFEKSPFKHRSELNPEDFTLTVRKLTLQDSGDFMFISGLNNKQRPSVIITLQVHEPITKQPVITISSTWISSNESCKVLLECSTTGDVSYKWTVGNQTLTGPRQQYIIREQDGETNVTCTVSNYVSEKSAFQTVKCSKDHSHRKETEDSSSSCLVMFIAGLFTGVLITVLLLFLLYCIKSKGSHSLKQSTRKKISNMCTRLFPTVIVVFMRQLEALKMLHQVDHKYSPSNQTRRAAVLHICGIFGVS